MIGYYSNFCRNFSDVANPLTGFLSKGISFKWTPECQFAFEALKTLLWNAPVLPAPHFDKAFKLEVDASGTGAGAVLNQTDDACYTVINTRLFFSPQEISQTPNEL